MRSNDGLSKHPSFINRAAEYVSAQPLTLLFIAISVLFAIITAQTPYYADDLIFRRPTGSTGVSWHDFLETVTYYRQLYQPQSNRIANHLGPLFLCLVPKTLFGILTGGMVFITLSATKRIISPSPQITTACVLFAFGFVFLPPWDNIMFTVMFSLNYIWATALNILTVCYFLNISHHASYSRRKLCGIFLLAFIAGGMHEGISVPLFAGMVVYCLLMRKSITTNNLLLLAFMFAGIALIITGPAINSRAAQLLAAPEKPHPLNMVNTGEFISFCYFNICWCVFILATAFAFSLKKCRACLSTPDYALLFMLLTAATTTLGFYYMFYAGQRVLWLQVIASVMGCAFLWGKCIKIGKTPSLIINMAASACILTNLLWTTIEQDAKNKEFHRIVKLYQASTDGCIFYDIEPITLTPALKKAMTGIIYNDFFRRSISQYYGDTETKYITIIPSALKNIDLNDLHEATCVPFIRKYGKHLVATQYPGAEFTLTYKLCDNTSLTLRHKPQTFKTSQGDTLYYLLPQLSVFHALKYDFDKDPFSVVSADI